jgi:hypothetical protein
MVVLAFSLNDLGSRWWFPKSQKRDLGHPLLVVQTCLRDMGHLPAKDAISAYKACNGQQ